MRFFEEYQRLINNMPHPSGIFTFTQNNSTNFGNYIFNSLNIYFGFDIIGSNNSCYIFDCYECKECIDCTRCNKCEKCYDCIHCYKSFGLSYCDYCAACIDCYFCLRCKESNNCFGCIQLENKQYCIFNKQYSKKEYEQKLQELLQRPPSEHLKKLYELAIKYPAPHKARPRRNPNINSPYGNYFYRSINSYYCFDCTNLTGCGYMFDNNFMENSWDCLRCDKCIDCYECIDTFESNNSSYLFNSSKCSDSTYCYWCKNCQDCIGCVNLTGKQYCVLNRQFEKETYEKVKELIIQNLDTDLQSYFKSIK